MPSALAILNVLVDRNLRYSSLVASTVQASGAEGMEALIRATRHWLFPMTRAVVQADLDKVTMRSTLAVKDGGVRVSMAPAAYDEDAFLSELVEALADIEIMESSPRCHEVSPHGLGRRLAAAALTAHARIADRAMRQLVVAWAPGLGEDAGAVEAGVSTVLRLLPGEVLTRLPEFEELCAVGATNALFRRIKEAIHLLRSNTARTKKAAKAAEILAREGLYYLATVKLNRQFAGKPVRLKCDRPDAILELLEEQPFAFDGELAVDTMILLGIWKSRPTSGKNPLSELLPNHEGVLTNRGKMLFAVEQARLWQASGMLGTAVLCAVAPTATKRAKVLKALVKEEILNEESAQGLLESCRTYNLAPMASTPVVRTVRRQKAS